MTLVLVAGTGTDIGKTISTSALVTAVKQAGRDVVVVKPAQTGFPGETGGDLDTVRDLTGETNLVGFVRYPEAMAPVAAAERAGMALLSLDDVAEKLRELDQPGRVVFVEGAGGLLVRLGGEDATDKSTQWTMADLSAKLPGAQTVIVTAMGLGSLNEAEMAVEVAKGRGMNVVGLVAGSVPASLAGIADAHACGDTDETGAITNLDEAIVATNLRDMADLTGVPFIATVPHGCAGQSSEEFSAAAPGWFTHYGKDWVDTLR